jgi:hypothetical protein
MMMLRERKILQRYNSREENGEMKISPSIEDVKKMI